MGISRHFLIPVLVILLAEIACGATLHGKIYDIDLNELNNVVVVVNSTPIQRFVSKDGAYSFKLNLGKYLLTANYSPDSLHEYTTIENVSIKQEGDYVYDLFLFPEFDVEAEEILREGDLIDIGSTVVEEKKSSSNLIIAGVALLAIILLIIAYFVVGRKRKSSLKKELREADRLEKITEAALSKEKHAKEPAAPKQERREAGGQSGQAEELAAKEHKPHTPEHGELDEDLQQVIEIIKKEGGRTTQKELRKQIPLSEAKISLMITELEHKHIVQKMKKGRGNIIVLKKK